MSQQQHQQVNTNVFVACTLRLHHLPFHHIHSFSVNSTKPLTHITISPLHLSEPLHEMKPCM